MNICYGTPPCQLGLRSTTRYLPEQVEALARRIVGHPLSLMVDNERVAIPDGCLPFAAALVASYHNQTCYNLPPEDGSAAETAAMERAAAEHMQAQDSDFSDNEYCWWSD